ncbi:hypothetical protein DPMN_044090 [Dreissena polymorpha]|uniref:Uncharacterized protein n=1 Tax=Dreissena polymorpha TaxID=45954 RepID=A0A9D4HYK6_DREPO|nr:hypothetical protein DPMN_044090 [Dreissena polymorpha]
MDVMCCGCSQHSHHCLSVSAWMYSALGVYSQVITAFLCQHGCIVLWMFTTKSLLPFCVSTDVFCSGCSQPSHYCLSVSAWMYHALGVHNQVISACVSMDVSCSRCLQPSHYRRSLSAWMYRALGIHNQVIIAFFFSNIAKSPFYYDILAAERTIWGSP